MSVVHLAVVALACGTAAVVVAEAQQQRPPASYATFGELFDEYRRRDAVAAATEFGQWPDKRVRTEAVLPPGVNDAPTLIALAMFHTEAGIATEEFGALTGGLKTAVGLGYWGLEKIFEAHSYLAYKLVEELEKRAEDQEDPELHRFTLSWYIVAMSFCHRWGRFPCVQSLLEKGEPHFDDSAEFRLVKGSVKQITRLTKARVKGRRLFYRELQAMAQLPRWEFKQALKIDPSLIEARVRLAHTTHVYLNYPEAQKEIEQALAEARAARNMFCTHVAAMVLGELHEDAGRLGEAAVAYQIAVDARPAHIASVALGQALVRLGRRDEGLDVGRRMFGFEGPGVDPIPDPYAMYHFAQSWQTPDRLEWMRAMGRLSQEVSRPR
jgi:tetratricopeptide (TPR) repeat protein